ISIHDWEVLYSPWRAKTRSGPSVFAAPLLAASAADKVRKARAHSSTAERGTHNPWVAGSNPAGPSHVNLSPNAVGAYLPALGSAAEDPNRRGRLPQLRADRMSQHVRVPSYRLHKQSGQAVVTLSDGTGGRRDVLLGKYGSPKSRADYTRVVSE